MQEEKTLVSPQEFAKKIRDKYNAYHDVSDEQLIEAFLQKYPVYKDNIDYSQKKNEDSSAPESNLDSTSADGSLAFSTIEDDPGYVAQAKDDVDTKAITQEYRNAIGLTDDEKAEIENQIEQEENWGFGITEGIKQLANKLNPFTDEVYENPKERRKNEISSAWDTEYRSKYGSPSDEKIERVYRDEKRAELTQNKLDSKTEEYIENIGDDKQKQIFNALEINREKVSDALKKKILIAEAANEKANELAQQHAEVLEQLEKGIASHDPNRQYPEEYYQRARDLQQQKEALEQQLYDAVNDAETLNDEVYNNQDDLMSFDNELDLFKRNYNRWSNFGGKALGALADMGINLAKIGSVAGNPVTGQATRPLADLHLLQLKNEASEYKEGFRRRKTHEDIDSLESLAEWALDIVAEQTPNTVLMMSTGGASLPIMATSAGGEKLFDIEREEAEDGVRYSDVQKVASVMTSAAAEWFFERVSLGQIKSAQRAFRSAGEEATKAATKNWAVNYAKDAHREGASEFYTELAGILNDKFILGKEVDVIERLGVDGVEAYLSGPIMSGVYRIPAVAGYVARTASNRADRKRIKENIDKVNVIDQQLASEDVSDEVKQTLSETKKTLLDDTKQVIDEATKKTAALPDDKKKELAKVEVEKNREIKKAEQIQDDQALEQSAKEILLEVQKGKVENLDNQKETILEGEAKQEDGGIKKETKAKQDSEDEQSEFNNVDEAKEVVNSIGPSLSDATEQDRDLYRSAMSYIRDKGYRMELGELVKKEAKPETKEKLTQSRITSVKGAEFDISSDSKGNVVTIKSAKDGREIPKFVERNTKKGKKVVKNGMWSKIASDATGIITENQANQERKEKVRQALDDFTPATADELALDYLARGNKLDPASVKKETRLSDKETKWATLSRTGESLPTIEAAAEKMAEDSGLNIDPQDIRNALIDAVTTKKSSTEIQDELVNRLEQKNQEASEQEAAAILGTMSESEKALMESTMAEDDYLSELTDQEVIEYYESQQEQPGREDEQVEKTVADRTEKQEGKTKSPELEEVNKQIKEAENKVSKAKNALERKAKSLDKSIVEDQPDLFGERKSQQEEKLFDERADVRRRDKATAKERQAVKDAEAELKKLKDQKAKIEKGEGVTETINFDESAHEKAIKENKITTSAEKQAKDSGELLDQDEAQERIESWRKIAEQNKEQYKENKNKIVLSLFDYTGNWTKGYHLAGHPTIHVDIQHTPEADLKDNFIGAIDAKDFNKTDALSETGVGFGIDMADDVIKSIESGGMRMKIGGNILKESPLYFQEFVDRLKEYGYEIEGVLAAVPCTTFAGSGARHWKGLHDKKNAQEVRNRYGKWAEKIFDSPNEYNQALVDFTQMFIGMAAPKFSAIENPVGRMAKQMGLGKPQLQFQPHNYGDPYTKRTQLWGLFNPNLPQANVSPTEGSKMQAKLGSKNKIERSTTPEGFAMAFYMANSQASEQTEAQINKDKFPHYSEMPDLKKIRSPKSKQIITDFYNTVNSITDDVYKSRNPGRRIAWLATTQRTSAESIIEGKYPNGSKVSAKDKAEKLKSIEEATTILKAYNEGKFWIEEVAKNGDVTRSYFGGNDFKFKNIKDKVQEKGFEKVKPSDEVKVLTETFDSSGDILKATILHKNKIIETKLVNSLVDTSKKVTYETIVKPKPEENKATKDVSEVDWVEAFEPPSTVRELSDMNAQGSDRGLISGAVFSALEKGDKFKVSDKEYTVTTRTKPKSKVRTNKNNEEVAFKASTIRIKSEDGKNYSAEFLEFENGAKTIVSKGETRKKDPWGQLSRDIGGDILTDLVNENNRFHEVSDSFKLAQKYLDGLPRRRPQKATQKEIVAKSVKDEAKSIQEIAKETKIKEPNIRRILGVGAKEGLFERVDKGVYILKKDGQDIAFIETADSLEALPRLAKEGFKADMIFLDIPYNTVGVKGGNRGVDYSLISQKDFKDIVVPAIKKIARTKDSPIVYMYSNSKTGWKQMSKYNDIIKDSGLQVVAKGTYSKTYKSGKPMKFGKYPMPPEGLLIFNQSGKPVGLTDGFDIQAVAPLYKGHYQTEKAPKLLRAIIEGTTYEGQMVLDPFSGSGVTAEQAVESGRKAYAIEKSKDAVEDRIKPRVKRAVKKRTLFEQQAIENAENLQDYGEKIGGARKDLYQKIKDITRSDIEKKTLNQIFPEPNYEELVNEKVLSLDEALIVAYSRDAIPRKPRKTFALERWVKKVENFIENMNYVFEKEGFGEEFIRKMQKVPSLYNEFDRYRKIQKAFGFPQNKANLGSLEIRAWNEFDKDIKTTYGVVKGHYILGSFDTFEKAVEGLKSALEKTSKSKVKLDLWQDRKTKEIYIGKKTANGVVKLVGGFETSRDARAHLELNRAEIEQMWLQMKDIPDERSQVNRKRVGTDWRKGENITSEKLAKTFGFRAIEYGNWVNTAERQKTVNEAYDALMDMANVLGLKPESLSLNGTLALAFGARGKKGAMAHYEPNKTVINLTKKKGAGSLAHEWWHAFDNYLEKQRPASSFNRSNYLTERPRQLRVKKDGLYVEDTSIRKEVIDAFSDLTKVIQKETELPKRSGQLDRLRSKAYWGTIIEMTARAFESYVMDRLYAQNEHNDFLANFKESGTWISDGANIKNYPYPLKEEAEKINAAYDNVFNAIANQEHFKKSISDILDEADQKLKKFGDENLSVGLPVAVARGAIKAMKLAIQAGKRGEAIIKAGLDYIKKTDWYKKLTRSEKLNVNTDLMMQLLEKPKEIITPTERDASLSPGGPVANVKEIKRRAKRFWNQSFRSNAGAPKELASIVRSLDFEISAFTDAIEYEASIMTKILKKFPKSKFNDYAFEINNYLSGKDADLSFLNEQQIEDLDYLRSRIDQLSTRLQGKLQERIEYLEGQLDTVKEGGSAFEGIMNAIEKTEALIETIENNKGTYMYRSYQAFTDPKYLKRLTSKNPNPEGRRRINEAVDFIMENSKDETGEPTVSYEQARNQLFAYLDDLKGHDGFIGATMGDVSAPFLKKRKEIPFEIRQLLGETKDPLFNYVATTYQVSKYIATIEYQQKLAKFLIDSGLGSYDALPGYTKISKNAQDWPLLRGMYAPVEVLEAIDDLMPLQTVTSSFYKAMIQFASLTKIGKTVFSPTTTARNFLSGIFLGLNAGFFFLSDTRAASKALNQAWNTKKSKTELRNEREKLLKLGVLNDGVISQEIIETLNDFTVELDRLVKKNIWTAPRAFANKVYRFGDDFYKVIGYYQYKNRYMKAGLSESDAENKAAERIRDTFPTYSMIPKNFQRLRRLPVLGTFVSFPYEVIRTTKNGLEYIAEDAKEGRYRMAVQQALGMFVANAFLTALSYHTMGMFGFDEDDDDTMRDLLPEWQTNSKLIYVGKEGNEPQFIDGTALFPGETVVKPIRTLLESRKNRAIEQKISEAAKELWKPFFGWDISAETLGRISLNIDQYGKKIYEGETLLEGILNDPDKIANFYLKQAGPGVYNNLTEFARANGIMPDYFGEKYNSFGKRYNNRDALMALVGFRFSTINYKASVRNYGYDVKRKQTELRQDFYRDLKKQRLRTEDEILNLIKDYKKSNSELSAEAHRVIKIGRQVGLSDADLRQILSIPKFSKKDIQRLLKGGDLIVNPASDLSLSSAIENIRIQESDSTKLKQAIKNVRSNYRLFNKVLKGKKYKDLLGED